ncbi:DUF1934 domain-containing protein [Oceanirhabdus sp. W0125-5]|uniref:DUF1934 domain-containing protein n=1 Tax=Oceanirhabdus sp. W0125-5 TaxID=2999116 RepID=UPI0022F314E2|nr:DUF1934 domain-containing protein [Oceanirhabdus sp. W0125-5]WBW98469.1 DUF1934 domain-containing protein [Oceanirhabdus sp. W0125-5]
MKKSAIISVVSKQSGNDDDKIEVVTPGLFYEKDGKFYIIYDETEISGMQGTKTTIKVEEDQFTLIRKGTTNTRMLFKEKYSDLIMYQTPHGMLQLSINIKKLNIDVDENGGNIKALYNMGISGDQAISTELNVNIKLQ